MTLTTLVESSASDCELMMVGGGENVGTGKMVDGHGIGEEGFRLKG